VALRVLFEIDAMRAGGDVSGPAGIVTRKRGAGSGRLFLRFWSREIILGCFQTGRMSQWAQAHFFVGRDGWRDAGASMPGVPAVARRVGVANGSRLQGSTGTGRRAWLEPVGVAGCFQTGRL